MLDISDRMTNLEARTSHLEALLTEQAHTLAIQFERIAQLQAEIDEMHAKAANVREFIGQRRQPSV
jgi:uncharacterized coiled-coil protein SlyX